MHLNLARGTFWGLFYKIFDFTYLCENYHFRNLFNDYNKLDG